MSKNCENKWETHGCFLNLKIFNHMKNWNRRMQYLEMCIKLNLCIKIMNLSTTNSKILQFKDLCIFKTARNYKMVIFHIFMVFSA